MKGYTNWLAEDITWCVRECPNTKCHRNQKGKKIKSTLISVGDMWKSGCPKSAKIPDDPKWDFLRKKK